MTYWGVLEIAKGKKVGDANISYRVSEGKNYRVFGKTEDAAKTYVEKVVGKHIRNINGDIDKLGDYLGLSNEASQLFDLIIEANQILDGIEITAAVFDASEHGLGYLRVVEGEKVRNVILRERKFDAADLVSFVEAKF
jgi:hypothetical protein